MRRAGKTYGDGDRRPAHLLLLLSCLVLCLSCSLEDSRDACCEVNTVRFRYLYRDADRFGEYISKVRYFLFDGQGCYLREMEPLPCCPARVDISGLEAGSYTLVGVGNLEGCGSPEGHAEGGLEAFRLALDNYRPDIPEAFRSGDRLYRGECAFTLVPGGVNDFLGEMSNVHCVLRVRVEWELAPPFSDGYHYHLEGVGTGMELCGSRAAAIGVHRFPPVEGYGGRTVEDVPLRRFALDASLVTLRWTDGDIPSFRLYRGDVPVTKVVDLEPIFHRWGWYPSKAPVQEYEIRMTVHQDGSIEVNQGIDVDVGDWEDGGTIG